MRALAALGVLVTAALVPAGAGAGARTASATYTDAGGDAGATGDITSVTVANDNAGRITFGIAVPDRPQPAPQEFVSVYLSTDFRPETGWYGYDYLLEFSGRTQKTVFYRWSEGRWQKVSDVARASYDAGLRATIDRKQLDGVWAFRFLVKSRRPDARAVDNYPDRQSPELDRYAILIPLALERSVPPRKAARPAMKVVARLSLSSDPALTVQPKLACTATLAGIAIRGTPALVLGPVPEDGSRRAVTATCSWTPRIRGQLRTRIAASLGDATVTSQTVVRVR